MRGRWKLFQKLGWSCCLCCHYFHVSFIRDDLQLLTSFSHCQHTVSSQSPVVALNNKVGLKDWHEGWSKTFTKAGSKQTLIISLCQVDWKSWHRDNSKQTAAVQGAADPCFVAHCSFTTLKWLTLCDYNVCREPTVCWTDLCPSQNKYGWVHWRVIRSWAAAALFSNLWRKTGAFCCAKQSRQAHSTIWRHCACCSWILTTKVVQFYVILETILRAPIMGEYKSLWIKLDYAGSMMIIYILLSGLLAYKWTTIENMKPTCQTL